MANSLLFHTIGQLHDGLEKKKFSPLDIFHAYQKQITNVEDTLHAYLAFSPFVNPSRYKNNSPLLWGIPFALKDNICTQGIRTTCASKMLADFVPPYSATVYSKLLAQGAVLIGKTNMDEFSIGATTETSAFGSTYNPWNLHYVPGGSSGGSAAAVGGLMTPYALGTDTGGSIRQPASFCGVVGFKPTYGMVSRYGVVAYASSLDQVGTLTKTVEDAAMVMDVLQGKDPKDATSVSVAIDYTGALGKPAKNKCIGIPKEFFSIPLALEIEKSFAFAMGIFQKLGCTFKEVSLPSFSYLPAVYYTLSSVEAYSNLSGFDGLRFGLSDANAKSIEDLYFFSRNHGFGSEVKRRILLGALLLTQPYKETHYQKALLLRQQLHHDLANVFSGCDALLSPVTPYMPPNTGTSIEEGTSGHPGDVFTLPANLGGLPSLSFPCSISADGLPIGMQLTGQRFSDGKILQLGHAFEKIRSFYHTEVVKKWT
ncbi:MAG: Asp-tRNA(Asn)/Glu-tRNA(Gln) amidotransferase subunit GatA [Clostridiales bacterium]|nr:Asp-tRNA(Asn)/Glu-tRNA(Gln) amidotransferase subunit GatA [Clostridiales bacterium]